MLTTNSKIFIVTSLLAQQLGSEISRMSDYAFGESHPEHPRNDYGIPVGFASVVNNGYCHCFATLVAQRLQGAKVDVNIVGSPTHVFLERDGFYYDARHPSGTLLRPTRYPHNLIQYDTPEVILREFPHYGEALESLSFLNGTEWSTTYQSILKSIGV